MRDGERNQKQDRFAHQGMTSLGAVLAPALAASASSAQPKAKTDERSEQERKRRHKRGGADRRQRQEIRNREAGGGAKVLRGLDEAVRYARGDRNIAARVYHRPANISGRPQTEPRMAFMPPGLPQAALKPLGRLVVLTDTDLPCGPMIQVAWPADHQGIVTGYLDSEMFNHFGWQYQPPVMKGEPGGAVPLEAFGISVAIAPRDGAWTYRTLRIGRGAIDPKHKDGRRYRWSDLDVGSSVLHIRFKTEIEGAFGIAQNLGARAVIREIEQRLKAPRAIVSTLAAEAVKDAARIAGEDRRAQEKKAAA
jgi:hypothetical protein